MNISARNSLRGKISRIEHGAVNSEVVIQLSGGDELVAVITKHSAQRMGLAEGMEVDAVIKASNVLLATD